MRRLSTMALPGLLLALLTACATPPRMDAPVNDSWQARREVLENLTHWEFTGRIGVRDANESHSSRIRWQQNGDHYTINLWGTLNVGATEINGGPEQVVLQQQNEPALTASTPEQLVAEQLGYELPVSELNYWIRGIPDPTHRSTPQFSENNQLIALEQSGWQVQYLGYTNFGTESLPTRIRIEKPPLRLDFVRLDWTLPDSLAP